jgi:hypothetical protein
MGSLILEIFYVNKTSPPTSNSKGYIAILVWACPARLSICGLHPIYGAGAAKVIPERRVWCAGEHSCI